MSLESRLGVVVKESVHGPFSTFANLAARVHESASAEFTYNRLQSKHIMQVTSIVPYVSLINVIGILRANSDELYESILDAEPTVEGAEELINRKAITRLEEDGFNTLAFSKAVRKMLRQNNFTLPTLREVYQVMGLKVTEVHFLQLCALGGVRRHFGFTLVTRRVMLPVVPPAPAQP